MYRDAQGVPQDYVEAAKWFRKAADQGLVGAQYSLGVAHMNGQGVPQDYAEAVKWFRLAADQGFAEAQASLGVAYIQGQGVPQDYAEAVKWCRKAADQGIARAQGALGLMYEPRLSGRLTNGMRLYVSHGHSRLLNFPSTPDDGACALA